MVWVKISQASAVATDEPGMASVKLELQFDWFASILSMVLRLHDSNIASLLRLSGYPPMVWEQAMKTATEHAKKRYVDLARQQVLRQESENA